MKADWYRMSEKKLGFSASYLTSRRCNNKEKYLAERIRAGLTTLTNYDIKSIVNLDYLSLDFFKEFLPKSTQGDYIRINHILGGLNTDLKLQFCNDKEIINHIIRIEGFDSKIFNFMTIETLNSILPWSNKNNGFLKLTPEVLFEKIAEFITDESPKEFHQIANKLIKKLDLTLTNQNSNMISKSMKIGIFPFKFVKDNFEEICKLLSHSYTYKHEKYSSIYKENIELIKELGNVNYYRLSDGDLKSIILDKDTDPFLFRDLLSSAKDEFIKENFESIVEIISENEEKVTQLYNNTADKLTKIAVEINKLEYLLEKCSAIGFQNIDHNLLFSDKIKEKTFEMFLDKSDVIVRNHYLSTIENLSELAINRIKKILLNTTSKIISSTKYEIESLLNKGVITVKEVISLIEALNEKNVILNITLNSGASVGAHLSKVCDCGSNNRTIYIEKKNPENIRIGCFNGKKEEAIKAISNRYAGFATIKSDYIAKVEECYALRDANIEKVFSNTYLNKTNELKELMLEMKLNEKESTLSLDFNTYSNKIELYIVNGSTFIPLSDFIDLKLFIGKIDNKYGVLKFELETLEKILIEGKTIHLYADYDFIPEILFFILRKIGFKLNDKVNSVSKQIVIS